MITDQFGAILQELGKILELNLKEDENHSCLLKFKDDIHVSIELDHANEGFLIVGTEFSSIPAGPYRTNVFLEALKANGLPGTHYGNFAYSRQADKLILFEKIALKEATGVKIAEFLSPFIAKAKSWKEAIERGEIPRPAAAGEGGGHSGLFGLKS